MQLSPEREAELIEQNMTKIYRSVDNFMAKCTNSLAVRLDYDDLVQEVSIAFLKYIRRCETEEQLEKFPWYDAKHAMTHFVMASQPFTVPSRTTKSFKDVLRTIPKTVSYEVMVDSGVDVNGMSHHWVPDKDTEIDFDAFMADQAENIQRIASMRLYGMSMREIAGQFGVCHQNIDKKLDKLRENYDKFFEEDENDE